MLKLFNTLTRKKEQFVPIAPPKVTMYSCGPTVYSYPHIGNMRAYLFMDFLRRVLRADGYTLLGVLNITDVGHLQSDADDGEDKMQSAAARESKTPWQIAEFYTDIFMRDIASLNIERPEIIARATDHIQDMLDYCMVLVQRGFGYLTRDGVYFDISKFPTYGQLSRIKLDDQQAGARVEVNPDKRNPADFALWKLAEPTHIMQWDSPWGPSYPGWHIECSAMSRKYLGAQFDIHTGGVDHIPIHHENEIAQSEAYEGHRTVNYWLHGEFVLVDGGKMSKSLGNTYRIADLVERGYAPLDYRYFCLNAHYRKKLNFTFEALDAAHIAYGRLLATLARHRDSASPTPSDVLAKYRREFDDAIFDDLNLPMALGVLWTMLREPPSSDIWRLACEFDQIFGLDLATAQPATTAKEEPAIPHTVIQLAQQRQAARAGRNWALSDQLRDQIAAQGFAIIDSPDGYKLQPK